MTAMSVYLGRQKGEGVSVTFYCMSRTCSLSRTSSKILQGKASKSPKKLATNDYQPLLEIQWSVQSALLGHPLMSAVALPQLPSGNAEGRYMEWEQPD